MFPNEELADSAAPTGMSDTTFGPNEDCTRAQIVTMLYRLLGE